MTLLRNHTLPPPLPRPLSADPFPATTKWDAAAETISSGAHPLSSGDTNFGHTRDIRHGGYTGMFLSKPADHSLPRLRFDDLCGAKAPSNTPLVCLQNFPHPLSRMKNVRDTRPSSIAIRNYLSYIIVNEYTYTGLSNVFNRFRKEKLGLPPVRLGNSGATLLDFHNVRKHAPPPGIHPIPPLFGLLECTCSF